MTKQEKTKNTFYITTPIYYASGKPHLGHAYTSIACDVLARWNRDLGKEVFFLTGTDEHGQKVEQKARDEGLKPKEFVDRLIPEFVNINTKLNISNDYFIRTTDEKHKEIVKEMLEKSYENKDIYKGNYEGLYCIDCERYYKEDELDDGIRCPDHKKEVVKLKQENYFFKLSKYQDKLLKFYEKNPDFLSPKNKAQETINRVKEGLEDISISRSKEQLTWGVEIPFDNTHVCYVWFDALFNYYSALRINKIEDKFWPCDVHVLGKDIMWFHNVYWPAFLMSVGLNMPKKVFAHGWWTVNSNKMGKSMGNIIEPLEIAQKYGVDEFRYFVLSNGSFGEDLDFSYEVFAEKINNELNNDLGNLVSRVHAMIGKYFDGIIPEAKNVTKQDLEFTQKLNIFEKFNKEMQDLKYNFAIETLLGAIRETNAYVNICSPWKEQNKERLATIMNILSSSVYLFAKYINSIMPEKSNLILKQYNLENDNRFEFEFLKGSIKLNEKENLFSKIVLEKKEEPKNVKENKSEIKREGFSKLNLKVGKIVEIRDHPQAEKLYIEKIDIGEEKPRQIISGLKDYYSKDELLNKKVIVVANLKPAKLRGEISEGMILAADKNEKVGVITTDAKIGFNLECGKEIADNEQKIKPEEFFSIEMMSKKESIYFNKKEITCDNQKVFADRNIEGNIR